MTGPPDSQFKIVTKSPEQQATEALTVFLNEFVEREREAKTKINIPESQENTRVAVTLIIVKTYAWVVGIFAAAAAYTSIWGDMDRLEPIGKIALVLSGVISPIVTFILGYYFATKTKE